MTAPTTPEKEPATGTADRQVITRGRVTQRFRRGLIAEEAPVVLAIALGGAIGATVRYWVGQALPTPTGGVPVATLLINASGCLLIGLLMTVLATASRVHRLVRPFLGTGVLGGYTTFSTFTVETQHLITGGHPRTALTYMVVTPVVALLSVYAGAQAARAALRGHR